MIIREREPPNLEMPFANLDGFITPNEQFYVRCHFPIPEITESDWCLRIEGAVDRPFEVRYDELCKMKTHTVAATLECAGNSRVFLVPKAKGVQWQLGAVGNAEWTGVLLKDVLQKAGLKSEACEVILEGADSGTIAEPPRPGGKINFARSLPKEKAMDDVLLALQMNGRAVDRIARISFARDCSGLVRDGLDQMAAAHHCHRQTVQWLLSDGRLRALGARRCGSGAGPNHRNAGQSRNRATGNK